MHKFLETGAPLGQFALMETTKIVFEAIALRKCVAATYNRVTVTLAPHILYTRHEELFIDAVTVEREGRPPRAVKLGTFKLAGMKQAALAGQPFRPERSFDPGDSKYAGVTLFAVETG
jgi:hypothetical protein